LSANLNSRCAPGPLGRNRAAGSRPRRRIGRTISAPTDGCGVCAAACDPDIGIGTLVD
jgi:hypothetical protein